MALREVAGGRVRNAVALVVLSCMCLVLVSGCELATRDFYLNSVRVAGEVRTHVTNDAGEVIEPRHAGGFAEVQFSMAPEVSPYHVELTVMHPGPVSVQIARMKDSTMNHSGSGWGARGATVTARSLFVVNGSSGDRLTFIVVDDAPPGERRLHVDRGGDGAVDEVLAPVAWGAGGRLPDPDDTLVSAYVAPIDNSTDRVVRFSGPASDVEVFYAVFPEAPWLRRYTEPVIVTPGSALVYNAWEPTGGMARMRTLLVGEPREPDVAVATTPDRGRARLKTTVPGQATVVNVTVEAPGALLDLTISDVVSTAATCCVAEMRITSPTGVQHFYALPLGNSGWEWRTPRAESGTWVIRIEPLLPYALEAVLEVKRVSP